MPEGDGGEQILTDVTAALAEVGLFSECGPMELAEVASLMRPRRVTAGSPLTGEGSVGQEFFVITEGHAQVERNGIPLGILGPGSFVGELALLDRGIRSATVSALTDLSILALGYRDFHHLLERSPGLATKVKAVADARRAEDTTFIPGLQ